MRQGRFIKEKLDYLKERYSTQEGLWDLFLKNAIWAYFIIEYNKVIFEYITHNITFMFPEFIAKYFAYLIFGLFFMMVGLIISIILNKIFRILFDGRGNN